MNASFCLQISVVGYLSRNIFYEYLCSYVQFDKRTHHSMASDLSAQIEIVIGQMPRWAKNVYGSNANGCNYVIIEIVESRNKEVKNP